MSTHLVRKLQEALGADATEELVSRLDGSDSLRGDMAEFRQELRQGFERIEARFALSDAKLDARFAASDAKLAAIEAKFDARLAALDAKFDARFASSDEKFTSVDDRFAALHAKLEDKFGRSEAKMVALMETGLREQTRFFFLAWSVLLAAIVGLYAR